MVTALTKADTVVYPSCFAAFCNALYSSVDNLTITAFSLGLMFHLLSLVNFMCKSISFLQYIVNPPSAEFGKIPKILSAAGFYWGWSGFLFHD